MKALPTSLTISALFFFVVYVSVSGIGITGLGAQALENTTLESPSDFYPFTTEELNLGYGIPENPVRNRGGDYLVTLDTFKFYFPRDGQTTLTSMTVYEFDENHNNSGRTSFSIRTNLGLIPTNIYKGIFDSSGLVTSDTFHTYNTQQFWQPSLYREFDYNQDGMVTETRNWVWNLNLGEWRYASKTVVEIEDGKIVKQSSYQWDESIQDYNLGQYFSWEYDDDLLLDYRVYQLNAAEGTHDMIFRDYFEYNDDRLLSIRETYNRQNPENIIRPAYRSEFFYNEDHLPVVENRYHPILPQTNGLVWYIVQREETSYTDFGKPEIVLVSDWLEDEEEWDPIQRTENIYDQYENLLNSLIYNPNFANPGNWLLDQDIVHEYNYDFEEGSYLTIAGLTEESSHMLTKSTFSLVNPNRPETRREYIYSELPVNTDNIQEEDGFHLFPNPVKDMLSIRLEKEVTTDQKITVVDITGRILYRNQFNESLDISTDQWPAGIYSVVLQDRSGAAVISRQFVKQ